MPGAVKLVKKEKFHQKLVGFLTKYNRCFIVHADNVGSKQFMDIRASLRPSDSVILMGKNTMIKRTIRVHMEETGDKTWEPLLEIMVGNVGLVFSNGELTDTRDLIESNTVPAPARVNAIAPVDVIVPAGPTGMGPEATSFFQVLNIATKINKGTVEILTDNKVVTAGEKVSSSAAVILSKMKITPFEYGLVITNVFDDGALFDPKVLSLSNDDIVSYFCQATRNVAALSLATGCHNAASIPHSFMNSFKNVLAIAVQTDYSFPQAEKIKAYLKDPSAFASAAPAAGGAAAPKAAAAAAPEPEEEEEEMGFDLFD